MKATVRGFLYKSDGGQWILSDDPQLKSCCVDSPGKAAGQIVLEGPLEPTQRAVNVSGYLKMVDGRIHLQEARIEMNSYAWIGWLAALAVTLALLMMWMRRKRNMLHLAP